MSCNCITRIPNDIKEQKAKIKSLDGLTIESTDFDNTVLMFKSGQTQTFSTVEIGVSERKRAVKVQILHTFCPFCGSRYDEEMKKEVQS